MTFHALVQLRERLRRRRRRIAVILLSIIAGLACLWGLLVEGTLLRIVVARAIGAQLGATCTIENFEWNGWNRAMIGGLSVRVHDWPESASEVLTIDRMSADFDPMPLLWGSLALTDITIDRMEVRAVERDNGEAINLMAITPPRTRGGGMRPPSISIRQLSLLVGAVTPGTEDTIFDPDARRELTGTLTSDRTIRNRWDFRLEQLTRSTAKPATLEGWFVGDDFEYSITLSDFELDRPLRRLFATPIRQVWNSFDLTGNLRRVTMQGDRTTPVRQARIDVRDFELTIPDLGMEDAWARFSDGRIEPMDSAPRVIVREGVVKFDNWRITLERLQGQLGGPKGADDVVPVPVELAFSVDLNRGRLRDWNGVSAEEWAEDALEHAPFDLRLTIQNLSVRATEERAPVLELPRAAAEILANFMVREGTVSIAAHVWRPPPHWRGDAPGPTNPIEGPIASEIRVDGAVSITGGRGGYFNFPYELTDVSADITFVDDLVEVHYLRGRGSQGAEISISGTVLEPGDDAGVDLRIVSDRAPIDHLLIDALRYSPAQRFLTLLFNQPAFASLEASGLITRMTEELQQERDGLLARVREVERSGAPQAEIDRRRSEIAAELPRTSPVEWLANFRPGGWCGIDLRVQREVAGGDHIVTTGKLTILEALALCEPFPYPLRVRGLPNAPLPVITVDDEKISLPAEGLPLQLPGGGTGFLTGLIDLPRDPDGERVVHPRILVSTENDRLNPLLLAAIPADSLDGHALSAADGWPGVRRSEAADLLDAIGIEGLLAAKVVVDGDGLGEILWRVELDLSEGRAAPRATIGSELAESGLEWPEGFTLDRCVAKMSVTEELATLHSFEGWSGEGRVTAEASIDLRGEARSLQATFSNISPGEYLVNLLPQHEQERARAFWRRHEPAGVFDAELDWRRDGEGRRTRTLRVQPDRISFLAGSVDTPADPPVERVHLSRRAGDLQIVERVLEVRGLRFDIDEPGERRSGLLIDGIYGAERGAPVRELGAAWTEARFDSPLLYEGLSLSGATDVLDLMHAWRPRGQFDAMLSTVMHPALGEPAWRIRLEPRDLTVESSGVTSELRFIEGSEPIFIDRSILSMPELKMETAHGRLHLSGSVPLEAAPREHALDIAYEGGRVGAPELLLVGERVRSAFEAMDLAFHGPTRLRDATLVFAPGAEMEVARFTGVLESTHASFTTGVPFTEIEARATIDVRPSRSTSILVQTPFFKVWGHEVRDAFAEVIYDTEAGSVRVPQLYGMLAGGSASATVRVNLESEADDDGTYEVSVRLVGGQLSELPAGVPEELDPVRSSMLGAGARGRVDGEVSVGGPIGRSQERVGRGRVEIRDGRMAELPITMSLLQVSQFMLPLSTSLDSGDIRFHISGDLLIFDRFDLTSPSIEFNGKGDLNLQNDELALRFRNRGTVPLWRDLFGAVSDTLFAIDVTGPMANPVVSVAPLPPFNRPPDQSRRGTTP
ncbi:MAG: hypothetical protein KF724_04735 [Phycisphaeraceae bacterium]|nr:hypothetical protein [Phycisphaeraceae bacterium]